MHFCNLYKQNFLPEDLAKLTTCEFNIDNDREIVPYEIFSFDVMDKFGFYLVTYAKYGCSQLMGTKIISPQTCNNYISAVRTYYVNHHKEYRHKLEIAEGFRDARWTIINIAMRKALHNRCAIARIEVDETIKKQSI